MEKSTHLQISELKTRNSYVKIKLNIRLKFNKIYWKNVYGLDLSLKSITNVLNNHAVHSISIMHLVSLIDSTPVL